MFTFLKTWKSVVRVSWCFLMFRIMPGRQRPESECFSLARVAWMGVIVFVCFVLLFLCFLAWVMCSLLCGVLRLVSLPCAESSRAAPWRRFLFGQLFDMPHDIAASEDGTVYVGDAHSNTVWKFTSTGSMVFTILCCIFSSSVLLLKKMWKKMHFFLFIDRSGKSRYKW